jgi:hypothetical protein
MASSSSGAHSVGAGQTDSARDWNRGATDAGRDGRHRRGKTPAQWYCYLAGAALLLAGIFGFIADASFDTAASVDTDPGGNADGQLQGDSFLGFEVNGWHNVVHLLSGLVLLAAAPKRRSAKLVALIFGLTYGLVTLIGLIDGNDVLGFIPVNPADNILHLALSLAGILSALASRADDHDDRRSVGGDRGYATTGRSVDSSDVVRGERDGRFDRTGDVDTLTGTERVTDRGHRN